MSNNILIDKIEKMKNVENTPYLTSPFWGWHKNEAIMDKEDNRMEPYHLFSNIKRSELECIESIEYFLKQEFNYRCFYLTIYYGEDISSFEYDTKILKKRSKENNSDFYGKFISYKTLENYGGGLIYLLRKQKVNFSSLYYSGNEQGNIIRVYNIPNDLKI